MAAMPGMHVAATTLAAIWQAYETVGGSEDFRPHLGASQIGKSCSRAIWYGFRWAAKPAFSGRMLRLFESGHLQESRIADDLRRIGCKVCMFDEESGNQYRVVWLNGHFGGSMDGCVIGIPEAQKSWHLLECKTSNAKGFDILSKAGVKSAKPEHYAQMQVYMHLSSGLERALYIVVNKDTDDLYAERVEYDKAEAMKLVMRAESIIFASEPPRRISDKPDSYECKYCDFRGVCHEGQSMLKNCRTCQHSEPIREGGECAWGCSNFGAMLSVEDQRAGSECPAYRPIQENS